MNIKQLLILLNDEELISFVQNEKSYNMSIKEIFKTYNDSKIYNNFQDFIINNINYYKEKYDFLKTIDLKDLNEKIINENTKDFLCTLPNGKILLFYNAERKK